MEMTTILMLLSTVYLMSTVQLSYQCPKTKQCNCNPNKREVNCDNRGKTPKLTNVPEGIPKDTKSLSMINNTIAILEGGSFKNLKNLKYLYLQKCAITAIDEDAFEGLNNLEYLDLSFNILKFLPRHATFKDLGHLQQLKLNSTNINIIPDQLLSFLHNLRGLHLSSNSITNSTFGIGFRNLTKLNQLFIDENTFTNISGSDFNNLLNTSLNTLSLKSSSIKFIHQNAFKPLKRLQTLYLENNHLKMSKNNFDNTIHTLCTTAKMKHLHFNGMSLRNISGTFNNCYNLTTLDLSCNNITVLQNSIFNFSNQLITLLINNNSNIKIEKEALLGLKHLQNLHLKHNKLKKLPKFANREGKSYIPHATKVFLDFNRLKDIYNKALVGLESVITFSLSNNDYEYLDKPFLSPLQSVKTLWLSNNKLTSIKPDTFHGHGILEVLSLRQNPALMLQVNCSYFENLTNLTSLLLAKVNVKKFLKKTHNPDCLFKHLVNLEKLELQSANIKHLPLGFFKNLRKLRRLILQNNDIVDWNPEVFRNLTSLQFLDVSNNAIQIINETSIMHINSSLTRLDAYANPFSCICQLTWFINWIEQKNNSRNFTLNNSPAAPYKCETPQSLKGLTIFSYKPSALECLSDTLKTVLYSCGGVLVCVIILTASFSYYFRWHIRYWWFLLGSDKVKEQDETERMLYEYDCYVTYSEDDDGWVLGTLLHKLEQEYLFRLCVHQRNFDLGGDKAENADKHIGNSKKMLVILTNNFVNNGWCKFELDLGNAKRLDENKSRDTLIIVMKEDVPMASMTPILRYLIRKKTYITWTEDNQGQIFFWEKLKEAIHMPITANYGCHENDD